MRRLIALIGMGALGALGGCSSEIDGPTPSVGSVVADTSGANTICTCDRMAGCEKTKNDVLTLKGSGFAPLPVGVLEDPARLELPSVIFRGPGTFTVWGDDQNTAPAEHKNPEGVTIAYAGDSELQVTLTPGFVAAMSPGKYEVVVKNASGKEGALQAGLEVVPGPVIDTVTPARVCPTVDQTVTVSGQSFRPGAKVELTVTSPSGPQTREGQSVTVDPSGQSLTFKIPGSTDPARWWPMGEYDLKVILAEGCATTRPKGLTMVPPPTLDSITPDNLCTTIGGTVVVKGKDFSTQARVFLGATEAPTGSVLVKDATTIELTLPPGFAMGSYDLSVKNPEGCATAPLKLEVAVPPTLTGFEKKSVCQNGTLKLIGTGFFSGARVIIGTTPPVEITGSAVTVNDRTSLGVQVGPLAVGGPYGVKVMNANGCGTAELKLADALMVTPGPSIVAVDPATVYNKVAFPITIYGSGFKVGVTSVTLGSTPPVTLTNVVVSAAGDRIDATVPANVAPSPTGGYTLSVTVGECTTLYAGNILVTDQLTVIVCSIDPPFGYAPPTGVEKTAVTITSGTPGASGCPAGAATKQFVSTPRAWLDVKGTLKPIKSVAFVTETSLTGVVEASLPDVGGPYDLLVQNPDGAIGLLKQAFKIVDKPVPQIDSINPSTVTTQFVGTLTINGMNFRGAPSPVKVELIPPPPATGAPPPNVPLTPPTVNPTGTQITVPLTASGLLGVYVVRVTNTDQATYFDFSALAVTNPSGNLSPWAAAESSMVTKRRRHAMPAGRVSQASRFLYAIGGDAGPAGSALETIDVGPLDKFGRSGTWFVQRGKLGTPRTALTAFAQGRFVYVLGGEDKAGTPLKLVERAEILDPAQAPEVTGFSFALGGTLGKGAWYYRVSAVMPATHATNPGGESLPSDPVVVQTVDKARVALSWAPLAGIQTYRIYRAQAVNGKVGDERLLAEVTCTTASCSFEDTGGIAFKDLNLAPMPIGSTGVFVSAGIPQLTTAHAGAALAVAPGPTGGLYVYVSGGRSSAGTTPIDLIDHASISADGLTLGSFTGTGKLDLARDRHLLVVGEHGTSPLVPAGTVYLFDGGGTTPATSGGASATVGPSGAPSAFTVVAALKNIPVAAVGYLVNDTFYFMGGSADGTTALGTSNSCVLTTPPAFKNCNSLGPAGQLALGARMNAALALESAYFYISGGGPNDTAATSEVIKTVY